MLVTINQLRIYLKWKEKSDDVEFSWLKLHSQQWLDALEMTWYCHGLYKVDSNDWLNLWFSSHVSVIVILKRSAVLVSWNMFVQNFNLCRPMLLDCFQTQPEMLIPYLVLPMN